MPYVLSGSIHSQLPGLWGEGQPYQAQTIYDLKTNDPKSPPVNYAAHTIKPHSITHVDAASHIIPGASNIEAYFSPERLSCFYGKTLLVQLDGQRWQEVASNPDLKLWRVGIAELQAAVKRVSGSTQPPDKLIISAKAVALNQFGYHDPNYIFVLTSEAASWLCSNARFNAFGTSWKSSDFEPGSRERPVHKILLAQAILLEYLITWHVPEGEYFMAAFPLLIRGASESPLTPVLFNYAELDLDR